MSFSHLWHPQVLQRGSGAAARVVPCCPAQGSQPCHSCILLAIQDTSSSDPSPFTASWEPGKLCWNCKETCFGARLPGLVCFFTITFRISALGDSFPFLCCSFPLCWWLGCGQNLPIQAGTFSLKGGKVHLAEMKLLGEAPCPNETFCGHHSPQGSRFWSKSKQAQWKTWCLLEPGSR